MHLHLPPANPSPDPVPAAPFDSVLFECSPDCVKLLDPDGHVLSMNRNGLCAMEIDDFSRIAHLPWASLWPQDSHPAVHAALDAAREGRTGRFGAFCPTAKGTPKWWDVMVTPILAADGRIERLLSVSRDVTAEHRAHEELRTSRARFALLLESSADGIYGMAPDLTCTFVNKAGAAMLGYQPEELVGQRLHGLIHHHHADGSPYPEHLCRLTRALGEGSLSRVEDEVFWRKDGTPVAVSYSVAPMLQDGLQAGAVVTFTDVTQRKLTERALQDSEERLRLAGNAAKLGIWVWDIVNDRMTWEGDRLYDIFGVPRTDDTVNLAGVLEQIMHPRDAEAYQQALALTAATGARLHCEGRFYRPPERELRWFELTGLPYRSADGKPLSIIGTASDITERKRAELALFESGERLGKIISQAATGVVEADASGRITLANEKYCAMLGYTEAELIGTSIVDVTAPNSVVQTLDVLQKLIDGSPGFTLDKQYRRKDGSQLWATSSVNALHSVEGHFMGLVGIVVDITERKQAEEDLKQAALRKDEFLAMLAHELRNPLAPVKAAAELLQLVKLDEARVRHTSQIIDRQVKHMTSLVDDLLDVSRVTRGLVELDKVPLSISQVVTDAVEQVMPLVQARGHQLRLDLTGAAPQVAGDKKRLVQVIANLLNNAAKYTHEEGEIVVRTEVRGLDVVIEVTDNGIGMPPELVARAFELFTQAERSSDRSSGGLGLGLALVKSLVDLHGGTVTSSSAGVGLGSTFTVCLPRLSGDSPAGELLEADKPARATGGALRVMVVDDNVDAAAMLAMLLEVSGHQVSVEHGSIQALQTAIAQAPDVLLLDIGLPEMDGNELAQRLRAHPATAGAVLIAVTGYGQERDRAQTHAAGFDHHLVKPVDTGELNAILAAIGGS